MTKFERIGVNYQNEAESKKQAQKSFAYSCNCCCAKGMHIDCDKCAIAAVQKVCTLIMTSVQLLRRTILLSPVLILNKLISSA